MPDQYFTSFSDLELTEKLPEKFTFPFAYEPHPLAETASEHLQKSLSTFYNGKELAGKMYGVLVVRNSVGKVGYLVAFSGQLEDYKHTISFVPSVHNRLKVGDFFKKGEALLQQINQKLIKLEKQPAYLRLQKEMALLKKKAASEVEEKRAQKNERKANRKQKRVALDSLSSSAYEEAKKQLDQESIDIHFDYKKLNEAWNRKIGKLQSKLAQFENEIEALKKGRKQKSHSLQQQLFDQYQFFNAKGKTKSLVKIFEPLGPPPGGAGDCAAPKLLQHAYSNGYQPLAMAEFWWGKTPKSQLRKEGRYYPACAGKCKPILGHMLEGLTVEDDPMLNYNADDNIIETLFEDEELLIINKPAGLLSIPSKLISDAVASRMRVLFPDATGPMVAHRLDKLTSGLMIITKSLEAYKIIQQQFINKTIQKEYVALLEGKITKERGTIDLPLAVDEFNRPMQMVSIDKGKKSVTQYQVLGHSDNRTLIQFMPITGRTHQLRVHSAHPAGLDAPIVGDTLYGKKDERLMLHAARISFNHPINGERLTFYKEAVFS
ncbi:MAG: tRNA pseudouridine32 synthase/23S rRNA pseudouridine746 synthase [Marivirga sp.]|jgi:tRNA pseudouridine32 synthase/23S rRNA pseudouridine746 synthase